jgi:hypothetical protein
LMIASGRVRAFAVSRRKPPLFQIVGGARSLIAVVLAGSLSSYFLLRPSWFAGAQKLSRN